MKCKTLIKDRKVMIYLNSQVNYQIIKILKILFNTRYFKMHWTSNQTIKKNLNIQWSIIIKIPLKEIIIILKMILAHQTYS